MANYISVDDFIKQTTGVSIDYDKAYGVQCVDGIKYFNSLIYGKADFDCGSCNYAYGLWTNYGKNGVEKYFNQHPFSEVKKGDWIIWNKGSKNAPYSHVGMYVSKVNNNVVKIWGEVSNRGFDYNDVDTNGILGVLRPKIYEEDNKIEEYLAPRGDLRLGDNNDKVKAICEWFSKARIDGTYFGRYLEAIVRVYQEEKGEAKVGKPDGGIGSRTLQAMVDDGFKI